MVESVDPFERREDQAIGDGKRESVTLIAGWDPTPIRSESQPPMQFVYLRAEQTRSAISGGWATRAALPLREG